jgi:hypothetical protein
MMLEWISLIATIITSIAVVGSLVFLALQVHAGLVQQKQQNFESVIDGWLGVTRQILRNADDHRLFAEGLSGIQTLAPHVFAKLHSIMVDLVFQFDRLFRLHKAGQIDAPTFRVVSDLLVQILCTHGGREWFVLAKKSNGTPPDLVAYLEQQVKHRGPELAPLFDTQPWFDIDPRPRPSP